MVTAPPTAPPATGSTAAEVYTALAALESPCFVVERGGGVAVTNDESVARSAGVRLLAVAPPRSPDQFGSPDFRADQGVAHPYMAGAMANGIASERLVVAMARAGYLASYGAAGMVSARVDAALAAIRREAPGLAFACNLIHSPSEPEMERSTVELCLRHEVRCVEASAFLELTPHVVRYRLAGLRRDGQGRVVGANRVIAKVSRLEVAELFMRPAPEHLVRGLVDAGAVTAAQADLARHIPVADDVTVEADSGGHTDRRPLTALLPEVLRLAERIRREQGYPRAIRVGAAGGIGTPEAALAAFALGAAYIVTGSINQASVESGQSDAAKRLLAQAGLADCDMAPSSDMFELGVEVQVLRRGTMFAARARRLYELYRTYDGIEHLPPAERANLETKILKRPVEDVWDDTVSYFTERDPDQIERAAGDPKRRMALIFRWYLGLSSTWSIGGVADRLTDYQIWCGPAMGAFNGWVAGTVLAPPEHRRVADLAGHIMRGAAFADRAAQLTLRGVRLPAGALFYRPASYRPAPPKE